jgi:Zn-dependent peptidase ImmA (M78 family)
VAKGVRAKITVKPRLLEWARTRADLERDQLARKLKNKVSQIAEWEKTGTIALTDLEKVAKKTNTPIGYLFLPEPPLEHLPVADFRMSGNRRQHPSPELLDTLYLCQQRQFWFREYLESTGEDPLPFVGSRRIEDGVRAVASDIRSAVGLSDPDRQQHPTWQEALSYLYDAVEGLGVLVMRNGIVGNNTRRKLSLSEFRGFALSDAYAPLLFVNSLDSKSAQMFTLVHELAHIWLGESGVSDTSPSTTVRSERFSNQVAAEVLVPLEEFRALWLAREPPLEATRRLARHFKVSTLVALIRAKEAGLLPQDLFDTLYEAEEKRAHPARTSKGGDFYRTQNTRLGKRFAGAVVASALEGKTPYTEAYSLLGLRKGDTFDKLARKLGYKA